MEKVFVYGSLRRGFLNHDKVLKNKVKHVEGGYAEGSLYHLPAGYPAIIEGKQEVYGEVFTIRQAKTIKSLDLLEGYLGEGQNNLYERKKMKVRLEDGTVEDCWVYVHANKEYVKRVGVAVEHGDWGKFMESKFKKK